MATTLIRRDNENPDQLLVRFNKISSRIVKTLRNKQYFVRNKSHLKRQIAALVREEHRATKKKQQYYV